MNSSIPSLRNPSLSERALPSQNPSKRWYITSIAVGLSVLSILGVGSTLGLFHIQGLLAIPAGLGDAYHTIGQIPLWITMGGSVMVASALIGYGSYKVHQIRRSTKIPSFSSRQQEGRWFASKLFSTPSTAASRSKKEELIQQHLTQTIFHASHPSLSECTYQAMQNHTYVIQQLGTSSRNKDNEETFIGNGSYLVICRGPTGVFAYSNPLSLLERDLISSILMQQGYAYQKDFVPDPLTEAEIYISTRPILHTTDSSLAFVPATIGKALLQSVCSLELSSIPPAIYQGLEPKSYMLYLDENTPDLSVFILHTSQGILACTQPLTFFEFICVHSYLSQLVDMTLSKKHLPSSGKFIKTLCSRQRIDIDTILFPPSMPEILLQKYNNMPPQTYRVERLGIWNKEEEKRVFVPESRRDNVVIISRCPTSRYPNELYCSRRLTPLLASLIIQLYLAPRKYILHTETSFFTPFSRIEENILSF